MAGPRITPASLYESAGIDPKAVDKKQHYGTTCDFTLKKSIKRMLRIIDEQDAVNRFTWHHLPVDLSGEELERLLYYKGSLALFYEKELNKFFILPFALEGGLDAYGRFNTIHPIPFASGELDKSQKTLAEILSTKKLTVLHDVVTPEELIKDPDMLYNCAVILRDYTPQRSQNIIPRCELQEDLLDLMSDQPCFLRTALMNSTGVKGVKTTADAAPEVAEAAQAIYEAAINGKRYIPIKGTIDFQELDAGPVLKAEEYLLTMQSLDNFRMSAYGIDNGGLFQKRSHMLEAEQEVNQGISNLVMADSLGNRHRHCNIANSLWGFGMWCTTAEEVLGLDKNGDGVAETNEGPEKEAEYNDSEA